jgi:hypothetical protein
MKRRQFLYGIGMAVSGSAAIVGSRSVSSVSATRSVSVEVVPDEEGYLGLRYDETRTVECVSTVDLVTITNQTPSAFDSVTVSLDSIPEGATVSRNGNGIEADGTIHVVGDGTTLDPGESVTVELTIECDRGADGDSIGFDVTASGEDVRIETTRARAVELDCECAAVRGVRFMGQGNAKILTDPDGKNVERTFTVWFRGGPNEGATLEKTTTKLETNTNLQSQFGGTGSDRVVAIAPAGADEWYRYPPFDPQNCELTPPTPNEVVTETEPVDGGCLQ